MGEDETYIIGLIYVKTAGRFLRVCVWNPILDGKTNAGKGGYF